ncbi:site-specific integrase [Mycobacterium colombiense]|uniref:Phage integrase family protein n=1 Tax=Mycobacterium colombiense CECT 3035 TaxID=1041522 RepID=J4JU67_9MYCO|nr:site-specific integrase [Mycobacterium colombiense]EJO86757.1 phage integrase family protein [Mycobacterium colombiense CECT 3035]
MAKRRANSQGNVYQRPNGRWEARLRYRDPDTGEQKRVSVYGATQKAALAELKKVRDRIDEGQPPRDATTTVAAWMSHWRATTLAASGRSQATKALYDSLSRKHIEAAPIGRVRLDRLRPSDVEKLVLDMRAQMKPGERTDDNPNPDPVRALADSTIRSTYTVLRASLDGAVRDGLLGKNPAAAVKRPGVERTEARHLDRDAVIKLLDAAKASRYHPALVLIASTGMRRGEAAALRWEHVDLKTGALRVAATVARVDGKLVTTPPKTERSRRQIPLSAPVVEMLRAHRARQKRERLQAGDQWRESDLVFPTEFGTQVDPRNLLRVIQAAAKKAGLQDVYVHTLRHSAASAWLEGGVHIKAVADLLGHSSISITGDIYGHAEDATARAAVDSLANSLGL